MWLHPRFLPRFRQGLVASLALLVPVWCGASSPTLEQIGLWLRDPAPEEWRQLSRFSHTLTRHDFDRRLELLYDPRGGLKPFMREDEKGVELYFPVGTGTDHVLVPFAAGGRAAILPPVKFRAPHAIALQTTSPQPLHGLRIAIEPADIGGVWGLTEDRSVNFPGYGRISEGNINLTVAQILEEKLSQLGAIVFLVRTRAEPVSGLAWADLGPVSRSIQRLHPEWLTPALRQRASTLTTAPASQREIATNLLLTKSVETRARVAYLRGAFTPDLTIILQHNATAESTDSRLVPKNRNIFFVPGGFTPEEVADPAQRFRLLTKLFENASPIEISAAGSIAERFRRVTGYPAVMYGNSPTTRLVLPYNNYVVARNLAFNREHDGPVIVVEPYFMNQADTLARLLAGDFPGTRTLNGHAQKSIYQEYADCVRDGLVDLYHNSR